MTSDNPFTLLGIRHHGPGSARSVRHALEELQPDMILVEGPPDAEDLLPLAGQPGMRPPVALLIYLPDQPQRAVYYPFAEFSPEWQAIQYGLRHAVPVRFMDLPQAQRLALPEDSPPDTPDATWQDAQEDAADPPPPTPLLRQDPLSWVAHVTGYGDGERWWEHLIEQRQDNRDVFQAILELMTALRAEATPEPPEPHEALREAFMRKVMRQAQRQGCERIAVVCGAWHVPALLRMPSAKEDDALLKGLPKVKVTATWVPWTHGRLTYASGYGAGIEAPGFYQHLWDTPERVSVGWLSRVAQLLREHDLNASTASVIEAVRLADTLASLRGRALPDLSDLNEATQAVFCAGDSLPLRLIHEQLTVGECLGQIPEATPMLPLQQDLLRLQKRLRLPAEASQRVLELDLRKSNDLERSQMLHRLHLLSIPWGQGERTSGKGTFKENWRLQWKPELAVALIEANVWGNTLVDAATAFTQDRVRHSEQLTELTHLTEQVLLADLPATMGELMTRLQNVAAVTSDIPHLLEALPPLANILRYGNVRQTDTGLVAQVVNGLATRICIGLPAACSALDDEAAQSMFSRLLTFNNALTLLQDDQQLQQWRAVLQRLVRQQGLHGLLAGRGCRLLFEQNELDVAAVEEYMALAISMANEPHSAASWIEGFLHGSGLILLHHEGLWRILDHWVMNLREDAFLPLLPLIRRTFATFSAAERRQMGARLQQGPQQLLDSRNDVDDFEETRGNGVLPLVMQLLGLNEENPSGA
ncbi:MAG: hypothetical protein H6970_15815 [Gammaproteobacteria bacterium]|nr:hypothetical protein [Gammaproteobacteria bacterium]MCP5459959.1 hypothetical protein [Gammaproteobacteria bacterium]